MTGDFSSDTHAHAATTFALGVAQWLAAAPDPPSGVQQ